MSNSLILKENDNLNFILKIVSIISMFAMGLIFGVMPNYIQSCKQSPTFLGLSNSFAGGLFLGIGLFHILPESAEKFEDNDVPRNSYTSNSYQTNESQKELENSKLLMNEKINNEEEEDEDDYIKEDIIDNIDSADPE